MAKCLPLAHPLIEPCRDWPKFAHLIRPGHDAKRFRRRFWWISHRQRLWQSRFERIWPLEKTMDVFTSFGIASYISRRRRRGCADVGSVLCFPHLHSLFSFRIRKNTWVSPRIPDRCNLLMLRVRFQVSVGIPSTTLGGVECHNSSGAQHRAYCGTNDCVVGDRQERLNEVPAMQSDDAL
jgi:hypothetical protein